ncbi:MAG: undecaprenyldiphospho-muramoylpentapeptide beta-N-acetylglucosaminyltransferase [Alphaproteobacteria bacterium CG_4_10_14_0_2_um_filter_63_37]|nr:MAG: undecaprenyldiphospho-muramoylpentapeptide beta-N-acetylglucosaminyltransferase [Proteobacteria bacterium CG1_02_64_396]PJA24593.1 MAG: undecaprenyldiphospho-muramoylpentapeptide beta-N-acetylglucosaminyltransferase [Alphaproteobacteria bacterium CG_4_10_14_0_2_um_filter_63_37]
MKAPNLVIAGGGTGGHVFPALAAANAWMARHPGAKVLFIGGERGLENKLVPEAGFELIALPVAAWVGKRWGHRLKVLIDLPVALWRAYRAIRRVDPVAVLAVGGYAALAGGVAARVARVPLLVHEQNGRVGRTNRILGRLAARRMTGFPEAGWGVPTVMVGNPVRTALFQGDGPRDCLAVLGGSQGARSLNRGIPAALAWWKRQGGQIPPVLHQSGVSEADEVRGAYAQAGIEAQVLPFVADMGGFYGRAGLLVARSGAMTVAEIAATATPAVLVPLPWAADDHQSANAAALADLGGAKVAKEPLEAETLGRLLAELWGDETTRQHMAVQARTMARPDAAARIVNEIEQIAGIETQQGHS